MITSRYTAVLVGALATTLVAVAQQAPGTTAPKTTVIRFYAPVSEVTVAQLLNQIDQKLKSGTQRFVLLISSPGGSVFAGLSAYAYLKGIPAQIVTHNFGEVDSIATVIYCAGSERYSVPQGRFLMHGISANFPQNVDEGLVGEQLKSMQQQVTSIASVIAETVKKPVAQIQDVIAKRTVLTATEAKAFGLVQDIREKLYDEGSDVISIGEIAPQANSSELARAPSEEIVYRSNINQFTSNVSQFTSTPSDLSSQPFDLPTKPNQFFSKPTILASPKPGS